MRKPKHITGTDNPTRSRIGIICGITAIRHCAAGWRIRARRCKVMFLDLSKEFGIKGGFSAIP